MGSGRGSARLERTVRVREVGGSNPPAPTDRMVQIEDRAVSLRRPHLRPQTVNVDLELDPYLYC
jgi:hypothetical protein